MQYIFILGRNRSLSAAEIFSVFRREKIEHKIIALAGEILLVDLSERLRDGQVFLNALGGTIKIIEVFGEASKVSDLENIFSADALLDKYPNSEKKKLYWGLSVYFICEAELHTKLKVVRKMQSYLMGVKGSLREREISCRIVTPPPGKFVLDAPSVEKNDLIRKGGEIIVVVDKEKIYWGKTIAVQNFHFYEARDYGRPARDMKIGMMPPKLAQIMLNLSEISQKDSIIDPFCGTGVILQEAYLKGFKTIIGTDKNNVAVGLAKTNMDWFISELEKSLMLPAAENKQDLQIFEYDVIEIGRKIPADSVSAVVTEGTLGPRYSRRAPNSVEIANNFRALEKLYLSAFGEFKKILKADGKVVISFPAYMDAQNELRLAPFVDKIVKLGYNIVYPIVDMVLKDNPSIVLTNRGTIIYSRPDQMVGREIVIFIKK